LTTLQSKVTAKATISMT